MFQVMTELDHACFVPERMHDVWIDCDYLLLYADLWIHLNLPL
jgi:hypothetical protein